MKRKTAPCRSGERIYFCRRWRDVTTAPKMVEATEAKITKKEMMKKLCIV